MGESKAHDQRLFWGCFIALIATAFGFIIRAMVINDWATDFDLTATQKGELLGVGLWPFAISIVLFSLIIDKIGYGRAMAFAFVCHVVSAILTIFATGYWSLYIGTFIVALGNGTVEAVINPVVATMFRNEKTKWLNILHAGWPGGMVIGGFIVLAFGGLDWQWKVGLILVPTIAYGIMLFGQKFPVHERVEAGVSYLAMLKEVGIIGALIIVTLMTLEIGRVFALPYPLQIGVIVALTAVYGFYVRSLGRPLFIFLLLIMMPLATTELGTDSWISDLMTPEMAKLGMPGVIVLIYTSFIMMLLRFFAGSIVHRISPLGLLAMSAVIAIVGLVLLSQTSGFFILAAATLYACGKTFFWPTTLGVVAERFPKGGALTMNTIAGVGMLSVGTVGTVFLGAVQDASVESHLKTYDAANQTQIASTYVTKEETGIFGDYMAVDSALVTSASEDEVAAINDASAMSKKDALLAVAVMPAVMLVCYLLLIVYFRSQGGYKVVHIDESSGAASG